MWKARSDKKELLDDTSIPVQALFRNLRELDFINAFLGGYAVSLRALGKIMDKGKKYVVADIGCGGCDTLKRIKRLGSEKGIDMELNGIDLKQDCLDYAARNLPDGNIRLICDDYRMLYRHVPEVNMIHASLFCHHLTESEIIELIRFAGEHRADLVINDLERHWLAYYAIKLLTRLFSTSYLVRHDAPLSVLRGFTTAEWKALIGLSGASRYSITKKWAFRHEIIIYGS
jgi:SAM-dependent methyltransferase